MDCEFDGIFEGKTVLVTGHTGFKGSWLSLWLQRLGAKVVGYSLPSPTDPSNFAASNVADGMVHLIGDVRDYSKVKETFQRFEPEVIFHLAAQPIVLHSFENPKETFDINSGGTVNILEAAKACPSVKAMVMITSDKCYENNEWIWGYRENDSLGGHDPYSASKAMAELVIASYRASFFAKSGPAVASARAGNVIGGGDFSDKRIVPDCMKALMNRAPVQVRNPLSVRPWLNVLDPLSGYLWLAASLLKEGRKYAEAWNFGPLEYEAVTVQELVEKASALWGEGDWVHTGDPLAKPEMGLLRLCWDKAANRLKWRPAYNWEEALEETVDWFKAFQKKMDMREVCLEHIQRYVERAAEQNITWTRGSYVVSSHSD